MSTAYRPEPELSWVSFWEKVPSSLREEIVKPEDSSGTANTTETSRCLTDGSSFLWVYTGDPVTGTVSFERYGSQSTILDIIGTIEEHYDVELISEHDDRFFEGQENEDADDE